MSRARRLGIGTILLVAVFGLLWFLPASGTDMAGLVGLTDEALKEKQRLLDGIAKGQILYYRGEQYVKSRPLTSGTVGGFDWTLPEHIRSETWMAADENGQTTTYTHIGPSVEGEVLIHSTLENGHMVYRNLGTGEQTSLPVSGEQRFEPWLEGRWSLSRRLSDRGFEFVGSGWVDGMRTAIFQEELEHTTSSNRPSDQRERMQVPSYRWYTTRTVVQRLEFPLDKPVLYRMTQWEMDEAGERTLTHDLRIVEYRLLPADTQIGPFADDGN